MSQPASSYPPVRFGEFELNVQTGELSREGQKTALQEKPFQVLMALLERPGDLVTREELKARLWPSGTYVDFDHSLNKAMNRLRDALGDSAEQPRYIETLPKRGYRFVSPIHRELDKPKSSKMAAVVELKGPVGGESEAQLGMASRPTLARGTLILAIVVMAAVAFLVNWLRSPAPARVLAYRQLTHDGRSKDVLLSDGARLYFKMATATGFALAQVAAAGGESATIPLPFSDIDLLDIAPDAAELLLREVRDGLPNKPIYALPLPVGSAKRVGEMVARSASYSPDGKEIAYAYDSRIYVAKRDGSEAQQIAAVPGFADDVRWSPDGRRLRFTVFGTHTRDTELWELAIGKGKPHQVLPGWSKPASECCGQWTPDGRYFLFLSSHAGQSQLWALRESKGFLERAEPPVQLSAGTMQMFSFVPARGGQHVFAIAGVNRGELARYDAGTGQFASYLGGANAVGLGFSADGQWVAYTDPVDGTLWRSKADGSARQQLTQSTMWALKPRWSPEGSRIAFAGYVGDRPGQVFVISAGGGLPQQLTKAEHSVGFVSWGPDGQSLLIGEWNESGQEADYHRIHSYFLDLKTNQTTPLPHSEGLYGPAWSPDGRYVAIKSQTEQPRIFDMNSQKWQTVSSGPAQWITWSHDSRYIYFGTVVKGEPVMQRAAAIDGKLETVTSLSSVVRQNYGASPSWLGLAPDNTPLALRDVSTYDIYALDVDLP